LLDTPADKWVSDSIPDDELRAKIEAAQKAVR
jgi:hypothetical protein